MCMHGVGSFVNAEEHHKLSVSRSIFACHVNSVIPISLRSDLGTISLNMDVALRCDGNIDILPHDTSDIVQLLMSCWLWWYICLIANHTTSSFYFI